MYELTYLKSNCVTSESNLLYKIGRHLPCLIVYLPNVMPELIYLLNVCTPGNQLVGSNSSLILH